MTWLMAKWHKEATSRGMVKCIERLHTCTGKLSESESDDRSIESTSHKEEEAGAV